jgi:hypothetical protein
VNFLFQLLCLPLSLIISLRVENWTHMLWLDWINICVTPSRMRKQMVKGKQNYCTMHVWSGSFLPQNGTGTQHKKLFSTHCYCGTVGRYWTLPQLAGREALFSFFLHYHTLHVAGKSVCHAFAKGSNNNSSRKEVLMLPSLISMLCSTFQSNFILLNETFLPFTLYITEEFVCFQASCDFVGCVHSCTW